MGLTTCVHFAELPSMIEADEVLSFKPSRLGHGCFMTDKQVTLCLHKLQLQHRLAAFTCDMFWPTFF
jgi:hypothetical protein